MSFISSSALLILFPVFGCEAVGSWEGVCLVRTLTIEGLYGYLGSEVFSCRRGYSELVCLFLRVQEMSG